MKKSDVKIETMRGQGPGGQHRNKTDSCVRATHVPSGISVVIDGRSQSANKRQAMNELKRRLDELKKEKQAAAKKEHRDYKIHNTKTIRSYDFSRGMVKDHRTNKTAPIKEVMDKGRLDLLNELPRRITVEEFLGEKPASA